VEVKFTISILNSINGNCRTAQKADAECVAPRRSGYFEIFTMFNIEGRSGSATARTPKRNAFGSHRAD
jgi:hypothetical protein